MKKRSQKLNNPALAALASKLSASGTIQVRASAGMATEESSLSLPDRAVEIAAELPATSGPDQSSYFAQIGQIVEIPVAVLRVEDNVRTHVLENEEFAALVSSVRERGVLQNLLVQVRQQPDGSEELIVISGQRRLLASQKAGLATVPCRLLAEQEQRTRVVYGLIENLQREDLSAADIALAYRRLADLGASTEEMATAFGCHKKTIQRYLNLSTWPTEAIEIIRQHPRLFSTDFLFNKIPSDTLKFPDLLVARLRKEVEQAALAADPTAATSSYRVAKRAPEMHVQEWAEKLKNTLKAPVTMSGTEDNLRITIRCKGEQVNRVLTQLGLSVE